MPLRSPDGGCNTRFVGKGKSCLFPGFAALPRKLLLEPPLASWRPLLEIRGQGHELPSDLLPGSITSGPGCDERLSVALLQKSLILDVVVAQDFPTEQFVEVKQALVHIPGAASGIGDIREAHPDHGPKESPLFGKPFGHPILRAAVDENSRDLLFALISIYVHFPSGVLDLLFGPLGTVAKSDVVLYHPDQGTECRFGHFCRIPHFIDDRC